MKLGIMQPYFFPYLGYFQLINSVDKFVIYDNIEFTKKSWIRRNRILNIDRDHYIIVPLKKASDFTFVDDLKIAETYSYNKILQVIESAYRRSPYFSETFGFIKSIIQPKSDKLFDYIFYTIKKICAYLEIKTELIISSSINIDHTLKAQEKVIALCTALKADQYINPIGGIGLYDRQAFLNSGTQLSFLRMCDFEYKQYKEPYIPNLSIIDVMMFNSKEKIKKMLNLFETY